MKCFFYYSNSHFAYACLASAMHIGLLPQHPPFPSDSINKLQLSGHSRSTTLYAGKDTRGNKIYAVWNTAGPVMVKKMIYSFLQACDLPRELVIFSDLELQDDLLSLTANFMLNIGQKQLYTWLVQKTLQRHYAQISRAVGQSYTHSLTATANYQIMLP